jgi:selenocysteine-specific elongation factor
MKGFGTVVTGTLVAGELHEGDELAAEPGSRPVKVRGLQVLGHSERAIGAGHRVAANLGGVEVADLSRGETLVTPGSIAATKRFDATIELLRSARALRHGTRVRFHQGTAELLGRVSVPEGGELAPGAIANVRIRLEAPAVLTRGDRFIRRAYSPPVTIAGGEVLDPQPPRTGVRTIAGRARFDRWDAKTPPVELVAAAVNEAGAAGLPGRALQARLGLSAAAARDAVSTLQQAGRVRELGEVLVAESVVAALAAAVVHEVEAHHRVEPLSDGIPREELRVRLFGRAHPDVFEAVLAQLAADRRVAGRDRIAAATHRVELSGEELAARQAIEESFRESGLTPLAPSELPARLGVRGDVADRMLKLLVRQRVLVRVEELFFHRDALERLKTEVAALKASAQPARIDVGSFKEKFGVTRKFAIPLLEYLDRERVTRRMGDARVVL